MNWVSLCFINAVCHQLKHEALKQVSDLADSWSTIGAEHREKRREFAFSCTVYDRKISYSIEEFDIISSVNLETYSCEIQWREQVSLAEFKRNVLPTVASLATNCTWWYVHSDQNRILFNAFKNCTGFDEVCVKEQGQESRDFVASQVELGNVQRLHVFHQEDTFDRPEFENLAHTLETFVKSVRFHELIHSGGLANDVELYALFLERALAGELKPEARIWNRKMFFNEGIRVLHPECRKDSKEIAWRIPNSDRRITLERAHGTFRMEVKRAS